MNREIKFRAWDPARNRMIVQSEEGAEIYVHTRTAWMPTYGDFDDLILSQYTGLKDKNGKAIYEGDIVTCEICEREMYDDYAAEHPVVWDTKCAGFYPFIKGSQWRSEVSNIEVIGNIYENPELLSP